MGSGGVGGGGWWKGGDQVLAQGLHCRFRSWREGGGAGGIERDGRGMLVERGKVMKVGEKRVGRKREGDGS